MLPLPVKNKTMKISLNLTRFNFNHNIKRNSYQNLAPLKADSVSFGAMKKSQFSGIDLFVINRFKAPIEKFRTQKDFQKWCEDRIEEIKENSFRGRKHETTMERKMILRDWYAFAKDENNNYPISTNLLILDGVTKDLENDTDTIPPVLNREVLEDTILQLTGKIKNNPKESINFSKLYQINLQKSYLEELDSDENNQNQTGWMVIPSRANDPVNFEDNIKKLQTLSNYSWCTKNYNARIYLTEADFHIYFEEGKPKLGIRVKDDTVYEIQGERNNYKIPIKFIDIAKEYFEKNKYERIETVEYEFMMADEGRKEIEAIREKLNKHGVDFDTASSRQIFDSLGMEYYLNEDDKIILKEYRNPSENFSFSDLGIDEDKLFEDIVEIEGDADFYNTSVTNLGNLKRIGKNACFSESRIKDLGELEYIGGNGDFNFGKMKTLKNLKAIGGDATFQHSEVCDLGKLEKVGGDILFWDTKIKELGNLKSVGGSADFLKAKIKSLGNLEEVFGNLDIKKSDVNDLGNLRFVKGKIIVEPEKAELFGIERLKQICQNFKL